MNADIKPWALGLIDLVCLEVATVLKHLPSSHKRAKGELKSWSAKDEIAHLAYWLELFSGNIKAARSGKPLTNTRDYLAQNDAAWRVRNPWTWAEVELAWNAALLELETQVKSLSAQQLTDANSLATDPKRPLIRSLIYEVIDHPLHHLVGLYSKMGKPEQINPLLERCSIALRQRGTAKWTTSTKRKLGKWRVLS